jgi:hypothetical protein
LTKFFKKVAICNTPNKIHDGCNDADFMIYYPQFFFVSAGRVNLVLPTSTKRIEDSSKKKNRGSIVFFSISLVKFEMDKL